MNINWKKILGIAMVASFFIGIYLVIGFTEGFLLSTIIFVTTLAIAGFLLLGIKLACN